MALLKTLRIERKFWGRGESGGSLLGIRPDNKGRMCCLGFYAKACGISRTEYENRAMPDEVTPNGVRKVRAWGLLLNNPKITQRLAAINDSINSNDLHKETRIKAVFSKLGVKVRFVGKG